MIIAAFNPKGGVGKTTTAVNVASMLAASGRSVLLIDLEADMNASISLGIRPTDRGPSIAEVLRRETRAADAVRPAPGDPAVHLITGSARMVEMDVALRHVRQPLRRLADVVQPLAREFEVIVLDAPSGFAITALSVPIAAQELIVPTRAEYLPLESLAQFLRWYRDRRTATPALAHLTGILLTMVDYRRRATREIVDIIRLHNRHGVFQTEIPQDPRVAEAPSHGLPLRRYGGSPATRAYERLTSELLKRLARRRADTLRG